MKSSWAYILAPALGYLLAHTIKYVISLVRRENSWRLWFRTGNMPSSHTAVVTALAAVILFNEGVSDLFAVAGTFAVITIYDAMVARRSIGEQGTALLKLLEKSSTPGEVLPRVALGHKPLEVIAGLGLGLAIAAVVAIFITI